MSTKAIMDTKEAGQRRRAWPDAVKLEIVAASFEPGSSVSRVARAYDVNSNQVFSWRKQYRDGLLGGAAPSLVPVTLITQPVAPAAAPCAMGMIEIEVPGGYRVRVCPDVDRRSLRKVLDVLGGR